MNDSEGDVFQEMVFGKISDIREAIDEIEHEIRNREDIDEKNLKEVEDEILQIRNRILEIQQLTGHNASAFPALETLEI